jgi:hypothetical protein
VNRRHAVAVLMLSAALAGCQAVLPEAPVSTSEDRFQDAWRIYTRCLKSSDPTETDTTANRLRRAVQVIHDTTPSVPGLLGRFVDRPPSRVAAEPKAMWAACALHAARTAATEGHAPTAIELLQSVLSAYREAESSYYVAQARVTLSCLSAVAALPSSPRLVSSR